MALHLHDKDKSADQHRLPFDGNIDWAVIIKKITKSGYTGATALEVINGGYLHLTAEEFLAVAFERAKQLEQLRYQQ